MRILIVLLFVGLAATVPAGPQGRLPSEPTDPTTAAAPGTEALEEFVPSEEVSADKAISFPVDI
jgi:hypothetical protein